MTTKRVANVVIQPALLYIATIAGIPTLHWLWPLPVVAWQPVRVGGAFLFISAWAFWSWGALTMRRAGTNILPINPSTAFVVTGPFRITRNPLYLAIAGTVLGTSLIFNTWWGFILLVPYQLVMHYGVVLREEAYLQSVFGDVYRVYCARVRRWL